MPLKFNIELNDSKNVPHNWFQTVTAIRDDRDSTLREKMLANLVLEFGIIVNDTANQLNFGTATVVVLDERCHDFER